MLEVKQLNDIFCKNVQHIQVECGIRDCDLAKAIGVSKTLFCNKMNPDKQANFNIYQMKIIAKELSESLDDMLEPMFIKVVK